MKAKEEMPLFKSDRQTCFVKGLRWNGMDLDHHFSPLLTVVLSSQSLGRLMELCGEA